MKILIDNGHGVTTPGKRSPDGRLREYSYCREIAREVVKRLKADGYDAELLVPEDADISLGERCNRVNAYCNRPGARNVCLVSIHNNAAGNGQWMNARGWEAWTSKGQTQGDRLADCLYDAAEKYLPKGTKLRTDKTDGDRDKEENFTILYRSRCAACLTENMFQDNREDVAWLLSAAGREAIVRLHVEGIKRYAQVISMKDKVISPSTNRLRIGALMLFLCLVSMGCTRQVYVPVESVRTEYKDRVEVQTRVDSVIQRDSVSVYINGDTVRIEKWRDRIRWRDREVHDTVRHEVRDSVPVPYPVERKLTRWEQTKMDFGGMAMGGSAIALCIAAILLIRKLRK